MAYNLRFAGRILGDVATYIPRLFQAIGESAAYGRFEFPELRRRVVDVAEQQRREHVASGVEGILDPKK